MHKTTLSVVKESSSISVDFTYPHTLRDYCSRLAKMGIKFTFQDINIQGEPEYKISVEKAIGLIQKNNPVFVEKF